MGTIRGVRPDDLDALYHISLKTGESGQDATHLYEDPKLVGHIYVAPYAELAPEAALVVEDGEGVGAYIVGAVDTRAFDAKLEAEWWPKLRQAYADPSDIPHDEWSADQLRSYLIHHPHRTPSRIVDPYPSHLHINLLPRLQGRDFGRKLIDRWLRVMCDLGSRGVHLGVSTTNTRAIKFYEAYGFRLLERVEARNTIWYGIEV
ncbi:MAG: GNAT family N-acetyltransferase [Parvibaculum sp.]|uniref:GNAT family N-acetyltransferase n=1 Tax=Parvibaculum sp. TaxID=2024848 RepID=UPI003C74C98B